MGSRTSRFTLLALLALSNACGSICAVRAAEAGQGKVVKIDACTLLLPSEIESALQLPVEAPERNDLGYVKDGSYSSVCIWKIPASVSAPQAGAGSEADDAADAEAPLGGRHFVILNAVLWPAGQGMARKFLDAFYAAARKGDIPHQPVPRKLGDDALWWGDGLAVRKGDVSFGVSVFVPGMRLKKAGQIEEALAQRVLSRIDTGGSAER